MPSNRAPNDTARRAAGVRAILSPASIAIVGANDDVRSVRGRPLAYLLRSGYTGKIYPISLTRTAVQGVTAYKTVSDVPGDIDVAIVVVPAVAVAQVLRDSVAAGVKAAVVMSSGFAERGPAGDTLQREAVEICQAGGLALLGPNCLGVVNLLTNTPLTFSSYFATENAEIYEGRIALVSQSGSYATLAMDIAFGQSIGLSHFVTTGNEADLNWSDFASDLAARSDVSVIASYLEVVRDGAQFRRALQTARSRGKHVVILKSGTSQVGRAAATAHTAAIAGNDAVFDAVLTKYGAHRVTDMRELVVAAHALVGPASKGNRLAIVTASGGLAAALADQAIGVGLEMPSLSEHLRRTLACYLPDHASIANPIDVADAIMTRTSEVVTGVIGGLLESDEYDMVAFFFGGSAYLEDPTQELLLQLAAGVSKPLILCWVGGSGRFVPQMNKAGLRAYSDPTDAITALRVLADAASATSSGVEGDGRHLVAEVDVRSQANRPDDLLAHLAAKGLPVVSRIVVSGFAEARTQLIGANPTDIYYLKAHHRLVAHKSDLGAVAGPLGPADLAEIRQFFDRFPNAETFELQRSIKSDWELIVGVHRDPTFGYTTTVGFGGVLANLICTAVTFVHPLTKEEFQDRLHASAIAPALLGYRGLSRADMSELFDVSSGLLEVARELGYETIEINPIMIETGSGRLQIVDVYAE